MGMDAGFDMVPRLSRGALDSYKWQSVLERIKNHYKDDDQVEVKPNCIEFRAGEHPKLPFEGHKFLRFSSKISGGHANGIEEYIDTVRLFAELEFGSRIRAWSELFEQSGIYSWKDVNESIKSYEQPDEPIIPTTIAQHVFGTDPISELNLPLFSIQSMPGKGRGLKASFNIAKGKCILSEKPLFTTQNLSPRASMESSIATKLKTLSKTEQRQFLSLHNNFPAKYPFTGIVKTNALPCGPNSMTGGLYPTISLINHSCLPNAHNNWNSEAQCETIYAIRNIQAGEEITISYYSEEKDSSSDSRRAYLKDHFGFDCDCKVCSQPAASLQASNTRRRQIQLLDSVIGDPDRVMDNPADCLADCQRLLNLLNEEYQGFPGPSVPRLYYDAFQISITHGDQARASVFADRGHKVRVTCEGDESPETRKLKELKENPAQHRNFGVSRRWRTGKTMVPKGLDVEGFETWLWRQGR